MRIAAASCLLLLFLASIVAAAADDGEVIMLRDEPVFALQGWSELREAGRTRLTVPAACDPGRTKDCRDQREPVETMFEQVAVVVLSLDPVSHGAGGARAVQGLTRVIGIATNLDDDDHRELIEKTRELLSELGSDAGNAMTTDTLANLEPFDRLLTSRGSRDSASYICAGKPDGDHFALEVYFGTGSTSYARSEEGRVMCEELSATVGSVLPDRFPILAASDERRTLRVSRTRVNDLPTSARPDELARRPAAIREIRQRVESDTYTGTVMGRPGETVTASQEFRGERFETVAEPAELELSLLDAPFLGEVWTLETIVQRLGLMPGDPEVTRETLRLAMFPLPPVAYVSEQGDLLATRNDDEPVDVELDLASLDERIHHQLGRTVGLDAQVLQYLYLNLSPVPRTAPFLIVTCPDETEAETRAMYRVTPTSAMNRIVNGSQFCAALADRLPLE